jgi:hypothetical protein
MAEVRGNQTPASKKLKNVGMSFVSKKSKMSVQEVEEEGH